MHILLIRLRMIGDVVFTTPAIRAVRRQFPDARISYLVEDAAAPIVQGNPHLDEVIAIPLTSGVGRLVDDWRIGADLRQRNFDMVIDFHGGPRGSWLTWLTRAPVRIGYTVAGRSWMYTTAVARPRGLRPRHSVQNQWDLLSATRHRASRSCVRSRGDDGTGRCPAGGGSPARRLRHRGGRTSDRHPRQRRQPVPPLAAAALRRDCRGAGPRRSARRRDPHLRPKRSRGSRPGGPHRTGACRSGPRPAHRAVRRVRSGRAPIAHRSRGALHRR